MSFAQRLALHAREVESRLAGLIDAEAAAGTPPRLADAMRHAVLAGGKRFRPFLLMESAALFGLPASASVDAAAALECIHCYSLVHDDLPAMDNDELRRGQPTVWKAFDEWTAILVGDGLQTLAFQIAASGACHPDAAVRAELVTILAVASGPRGMVGGQALDLAESHGAPEARTTPTIASVARLQAMKTGRLIAAACEMGAALGAASTAQRAALKIYGERLGAAFQISDDLLDAEGQVETVGKATGKDAAAGKATLVGLMGAEAARRELDRVVAEAVAALSPFGASAATLVEAAHFMGARGH